MANYSRIADLMGYLGSTAKGLFPRIGGPLFGTGLQALLLGLPTYYLTKKLTPLFTGLDEERSKRVGALAGVGAGLLPLLANFPQLQVNWQTLMRMPPELRSKLSMGNRLALLNKDPRAWTNMYQLGQIARGARTYGDPMQPVTNPIAEAMSYMKPLPAGTGGEWKWPSASKPNELAKKYPFGTIEYDYPSGR